jgi:transcription elongation factor Elf1
MSIMASFSGFPCPECGQMIMSSEIKGTNEPSLAVTTCGWCGAEIQVTTDPASGEMRAEKKKPS